MTTHFFAMTIKRPSNLSLFGSIYEATCEIVWFLECISPLFYPNTSLLVWEDKKFWIPKISVKPEELDTVSMTDKQIGVKYDVNWLCNSDTKLGQWGYHRVTSVENV